MEDFEQLKNLSVNVTGKIAIMRYGKIFRGNKVRRGDHNTGITSRMKLERTNKTFSIFSMSRKLFLLENAPKDYPNISNKDLRNWLSSVLEKAKILPLLKERTKWRLVSFRPRGLLIEFVNGPEMLTIQNESSIP